MHGRPRLRHLRRRACHGLSRGADAPSSLTATNFVAKHSALLRARQGARENARSRCDRAVVRGGRVQALLRLCRRCGVAVSRRADRQAADRGHPGQARVACRAHGRSLPPRQRARRAGHRVQGAGTAQRGRRLRQSSPVLIIAGGSTTHFLGKAGMQEIHYHGFEDATSIFRPVCKGTWMLVRPDTTIEILNYALKTATSGRPGPVFVEVPYDIQLAPVEGEIEAPSARAPRLNRPRADADNVQRIARMIAEAERPLLLAGGGVVRSRAAAALKAAAETLNIPTATTLPAKGMLPEDHPLSIGTLGRSGFVCAARASREADLVIGVGARFSDNHTANWRKGSIYDVSQTRIVQVDLDYQEVGRNFPVELGLVSDAKLFLEDLAAAVGGPGNKKHQGWLERTQSYRAEWEEEIRPLQTAASTPTHPARLVHEVGRALPKDGRVYIDIGDVTQYAEAYMKICTPGAWQVSPGMAEMGWASSGIPGALAADGAPGIALVGDGAFNMTSQVVASAVEYDLPAIWVILNNYEL